MRQYFTKQISFAFLVTLPLIVNIAHAADIKAESRINAVTVFPGMAEITRETTLELPEGSSTIIFSDVPQNLIADSLRLAGSANGGLVLGAVELKAVPTLPDPNAQSNHQNKIADIEKKIEALQAANQALDSRDNFINKITNQAINNTHAEIEIGALKAEGWPAAWGSIEEALRDGLIRRQNNNRDITALQQQLSALRSGVGNGSNSPALFQITAAVEAKKNIKATLQLKYQISGAYWTPVYEARLDTSDNQLEILQFADIRQQTGEDWHNVALTLSTARPNLQGQLPAFTPWVLRFFQPIMASTQRARREEMMMKSMVAQNALQAPAAAGAVAEMDASMVEDKVQEKAQTAMATVQAGDYAAQYIINGRSSIASGESGTKLAIQSLKQEARLLAKTAPRFDQRAFLHVAFTLSGETPLLPGSVALFRDGSFVGRTSFDQLLRPAEEKDFGFGADDMIRVKYRPQEDKTSESGLLGNDKNVKRRHLMEVENLHKNTIPVMVYDLIPIAGDDAIRIELDEKSTSTGFSRDIDSIPGLVRWRQEMKHKDKNKWELGYSIRYPKDKQIQGL
ncbi:MAG: mucoidy inhibitor MuiA family protein [Alphaproteobacteria bacterium]